MILNQTSLQKLFCPKDGKSRQHYRQHYEQHFGQHRDPGAIWIGGD